MFIVYAYMWLILSGVIDIYIVTHLISFVNFHMQQEIKLNNREPRQAVLHVNKKFCMALSK